MLAFALWPARPADFKAADGVAGHQLARNRPEDPVISDANKSNWGGLHPIRRWRALPPSRRTPFLPLTTKCDPGSESRDCAAGVAGWFVMSFEPEPLLAAVSKVQPY